MTSVSDYFREQMFKEQAEDVVILLVTVTHTTLPQPRLFSSDATKKLAANAESELRYGTVSRGKEYDFLPMDITLPDDTPDANAVINMTIENLSHVLTPVLRQTRTPATIKIEVVLSSRPDIVEADFDNFRLVTADIDPSRVTLGLAVDALMNEPFPGYNFTPSTFPGLFSSN